MKWRRLFYGFLASTLPLGALAGGTAFYLWCTPLHQLDDSDFHTSWSPEARAKFIATENFFRNEYRDSILQKNDYAHYSFFDQLGREFLLRSSKGMMIDMLQAAATSGNAHQMHSSPDGEFLLALNLAGFQQYDLIKELVLHDASICHKTDRANMSLFHLVLFFGINNPEARMLTEWLLAHGANPKINGDITYRACCECKDSEYARWAIDKGILSTSPFQEGENTIVPACYFANYPDLITELVRDGKVNINDNSGQFTPLQMMFHNSTSPEKLTHLLELGADPNLTAKETKTPLEMLLMRAAHASDQQQIDQFIACADIMLRHNATSPAYPLLSPTLEPEAYSTADGTMHIYNPTPEEQQIRKYCHDKLKELYQRYHITPTQA